MSDNKSKSNDGDQPISLAEHLSTVLDDEAGPFEQRRVLDELTSSDNANNNSRKELSEKLSHYALIGESMRSTNPTTVAGPNFLAGIHDKIAEEDQYHDVQLQDSVANDEMSQELSKSSSMLRPLGGFALAASFAAVAFMGVQNHQLGNQLAEKSATIVAFTEAAKIEKLAQMKNQTAVVKSVAELAPTESKNIITEDKKEYKLANAHARSFLKRYVDSHVQYASTSTFVPSVRVIAYADY
ncbi:MAG: sigma-E factor negative regulatory protein [Kangiellaceae bacterium]|nr:sigma-E factor negative regulatory protein [Kangiellaceae bacterium]